MGTEMHPRTEYERRIGQRRASAEKYERRHHRIGNTRFLVFLIAAVVGWLALASHRISPWWLALPVCVFIGLIAWHERVLKALQRCKRGVEFYKRGLARLDERWQGGGEPGNQFEDSSHPYAEDLDIFGKGSLFELLCNARTHAGVRRLASWLQSPAGSAEILTRQQAVAELRSSLDLREDLAALGTDVRTGVEPEPLIEWGEGTEQLPSVRVRITAAVLACLTLATIVNWAVTGHRDLFLLAIIVEALFAYSLRHKIRQAVVKAEGAGKDLSLLSEILGRLERETFETLPLRNLRAALDRNGTPPSNLIARLNRLMVLLDSRRNFLFAPVAFILMWEIQLAFAVDNWRRKYGHCISGWLATVAEMEALSSLAGYSYEHPEDPFPEIVDESPCFDGQGLGHPLIPETRCVRNDVNLSGDVRVLLVSGSNMSGKSTLLRTVGINAVLALAGAPVRARRLRIAPLTVGASIRIVDSLQSGTSRFYTEIIRLRRLVTLADGSVPLMFLLDELLHGTNSHDRRIGAEAIVKGLVRRGAIGLLTTHDLALAHIAEELAPRALNVHFEDHIENGQMVFDYDLRPGVVTKSNAIELMRSIGLEV